MQVAMSGLLGEGLVCVVNVLSASCSTWTLQNTTRMSMTVVVREALCVYAEVLGRMRV